MSEHTPGPWKHIFDADGDYAIFSDSIHIATTVGELDLSHDVDEANARLIAAAPELLAALDKYVEHFGDPLKCAKIATQKARAND